MLTMIGMLLVLAMIIRKARDADTWRFFASDRVAAADSQSEEPAEERTGTADATAAANADSRLASGANHVGSETDSPATGETDGTPPAGAATTDSAPPADNSAASRLAAGRGSGRAGRDRHGISGDHRPRADRQRGHVCLLAVVALDREWQTAGVA